MLIPVVERRDVLTLAYAASTKQEMIWPVGSNGKGEGRRRILVGQRSHHQVGAHG